MLGTREARVLVVEAVGSRSWSERIELELPALLQGRSGKGELVRRKPLDPLMRTTAARPLELGEGREGRSGNVPKARVLAAEASGQTGVRTKRCAGVAPERHREGMSLGSVRRCEASGLCG